MTEWNRRLVSLVEIQALLQRCNDMLRLADMPDVADVIYDQGVIIARAIGSHVVRHGGPGETVST